MILRAFVTIAAAVAVLAALHPAGAAPSGIHTASLGAYVPLDADMRASYGQVWPALSYSYDIPWGAAAHRLGIGITGTTRKVRSGFLMDAFGRQTGTFRSENTLEVLALTYTFLLAPGGMERGPFLGVGAGAHLGWSEAATTVMMGGTEDKLSDDWLSARGAVHAVAGCGITPRFSVEARYVKMLGSLSVLRLQGMDASANADGVQVSAGYRW